MKLLSKMRLLKLNMKNSDIKRFCLNILLILMMTLECCFMASCQKRGAVCFTFDDFGGGNWLKADDIFKKYGAHATFLVCGELTPEHIEVMKKLQSAGHTVGLHTFNHRNASPRPEGLDEAGYFEEQIKPQLDVCRSNGIEIRAFAYPNNARDEEIDKYLFQYFDYLRAGVGKERKPVFIPLENVHKKMILPGTGIGEYYKSDINELKKLLSAAAESNTLIVFFSHDIAPGAKHVSMPSEWLEELLKHASELDMRIIGAGELDLL